VVLDRDTSEDVVTFTGYRSSLRLIVSRSEPYRLFCDLDGDSGAQPDELYSVTGPPVFRNVAISLGVGDTRQTVLADIVAHMMDEYSSLSVERILSCYVGTLSIGGIDYAARIDFRSLFPQPAKVNEVVLVDTDGDGSLDPILDGWLLSRGIGSLKGSLWTVDTKFTGAQAEVSLEPYSEPTGTLEVNGEGIHQVRVSLASRGHPGASIQTLCFPGTENGNYQLPAGEWRATEVWLRSPVIPDIFYCWESPSYLEEYQLPSGAGFRIQPARTASVHLGGPLFAGVHVSQRRACLSGRVHVEFDSCENAEGLDFRPVRYGKTGSETVSQLPSYGSTPPLFEIRDRRGQTVASGSFEYG